LTATVALTGSFPIGQRIRPTYRTLMARVRRDDSLSPAPAIAAG
jgi:hypothetical protein